VLAIILVQEFRLQPGHVHVRRAFGLARFAFQAEVEDFFHVMVRETRQIELAGHREPKHIGPAARAVLFVAGCPVAGTHVAVAAFAALADADA
jgi:hypothetical protein